MQDAKVSPMPKTRTNSDATAWDTCPPPQTPLQREAFLLLCTDWLARQTGDAQPAVFGNRTVPLAAPASAPAAGQFAMSLAELRLTRAHDACSICDAPGAAPAVANPFTHRHLVRACEACLAAIY